MWISKKHFEDLARKGEEREALLREQYQARISQLGAEIKYLDRLNAQYLAQIEDLRSLVFPKVVLEPSREAREMDAVISASEKPFEVSEEDQTKMIEGARELDLVLSGNYDLDLLN